MLQIVSQYKELEQKITDLKEIAIIVAQINEDDIYLPKINKEIRHLIFQQAEMLK
jgi:hypothetical protein